MTTIQSVYANQHPLQEAPRGALDLEDKPVYSENPLYIQGGRRLTYMMGPNDMYVCVLLVPFPTLPGTNDNVLHYPDHSRRKR